MKTSFIAVIIATVAQLAVATPVPEAALDTRSFSFATSPLEGRNLERRWKWSLRISGAQGCPSNGANYNGDQSVCLTQGGNSIVASGSCKIVTKSGVNCQGSSQTIGPGCYNVPFASVQITC